MDLDNEELKSTREMSLYEMEQEEKRLSKELKMILHDGECKAHWRKTIEDTIKLLGE